MDLPFVGPPSRAVVALAEFVRDRLTELAAELSAAADRPVTAAARQVATVVVGAAAPFAPTSYARARLLRQMHASGLLDADETRAAGQLLAVADGAPH
jgi:hypothetical protein